MMSGHSGPCGISMKTFWLNSNYWSQVCLYRKLNLCCTMPESNPLSEWFRISISDRKSSSKISFHNIANDRFTILGQVPCYYERLTISPGHRLKSYQCLEIKFSNNRNKIKYIQLIKVRYPGTDGI